MHPLHELHPEMRSLERMWLMEDGMQALWWMEYRRAHWGRYGDASIGADAGQNQP